MTVSILGTASRSRVRLPSPDNVIVLRQRRS